ncbi:MAG: hypothetical protein B7Z23_10275, partial [Pseudomonadales bacterium 32-61-5]
YAMRIWLDPARLNNYSLTPVDVRAAIQEQNVQVAAGQLGGLPSVAEQQLTATVIGTRPTLARAGRKASALPCRVAMATRGSG